MPKVLQMRQQNRHERISFLFAHQRHVITIALGRGHEHVQRGLVGGQPLRDYREFLRGPEAGQRFIKPRQDGGRKLLWVVPFCRYRCAQLLPYFGVVCFSNSVVMRERLQQGNGGVVLFGHALG